MSGARAELRALTGARGVAAWLVVLFHLRGSMPWLPGAARLVLGKGYLAVDFFFLLSGFVIHLAWADRLRGEHGSVRRFWGKRVARIWPLHAAMLGVAAALALLLAATGRGDAGRFPPAALPLHLLLMQDWGLVDPLRWNDPAWSISAEATAYLLFPLLAAADWRRRSTAMLAAVAGAALVSLHLLFRAGGAETLGADIARLGVPRCLVEFVVGGVLCVLWERRALAARSSALIAAVSAAATGGGVLPETFGAPVALGAALLFLAETSGERRNPLARPAPHRLGEISFATYLSHFLLFFAFKLALVRDAHAVSPVLALLYLALVLAASEALHRLVERPAQAWAERLPARLAARSVRAAA